MWISIFFFYNQQKQLAIIRQYRNIRCLQNNEIVHRKTNIKEICWKFWRARKVDCFILVGGPLPPSGLWIIRTLETANFVQYKLVSNQGTRRLVLISKSELIKPETKLILVRLELAHPLFRYCHGLRPNSEHLSEDVETPGIVVNN